MTKRFVVLDDGCDGVEGRLFRAIRQYNYIKATYQDTWYKLFNTDSFKGSERSAENIRQVIRTLIRKVEPCSETYLVEFIGSKGLLDVQSKRKQRYLLVLEWDND